MRYQLGFIGCGNMAQAIAGGAVDQGIIPADQIIASAPSPKNRGFFDTLGCATTTSNQDVVMQASQIVLAVKPQVFPSVVADLQAGLTPSQVLISVMAGLSSQAIAQAVAKPCRVIRVMPNTPSLVGAGMAGLALGHGAQAGDEALALGLLRAVGQAVVIDESQIDALAAVSGSGPAYLFYLAEAMEHAAQQLGLDQIGRQLVAQTLFGAGKLLSESSEAPSQLRRKVTSPGGMTQAACEHLDMKQVAQSILEAIQAGEQRAKALAQGA